MTPPQHRAKFDNTTSTEQRGTVDDQNPSKWAAELTCERGSKNDPTVPNPNWPLYKGTILESHNGT
jgi:hypothetical protein